jgi:hypothetical protein
LDGLPSARWDDYASLLQSITNEWDRAEQDIKLAEQINNKVVLPSIKELRYAGRRIIEVIKLIRDGAASSEIESLLRDAKINCHRARHDAIDAATANIAADLQIMAKKLGYDPILKIYPDFGQLHRDLNSIRSKIAQSRGDTTRREAIYFALEDDAFPKFVEKYRGLQASEPTIKALATHERRKAILVTAVGVFNAILAAALIGGYHWISAHWKALWS